MTAILFVAVVWLFAAAGVLAFMVGAKRVSDELRSCTCMPNSVDPNCVYHGENWVIVR